MALVIPAALLLLLECVFRLLGYGGYEPVLRRVGEVDGGHLITSNPSGAASYFYRNRSRPGYLDQYHFVDPKPQGVFRVFIVGESAAKGFPQPRNLAVSAWLKAMLSDLLPHRTVEVINLGTTAVASYPVLGILTEALEFDPDLIIIHTGHNEFFGAYGVNSVSRGGGSVAQLKASRFFRSLAWVQQASRFFTSDREFSGQALMEIMAEESYISPDSRSRTAAASNLKANIGEMVRRCRQRSVPAIVCTLPSNERDLHPIGMDQVFGLKPTEKEQFEALLSRGSLHLPGNAAEAARCFQEAISIFPNHARLRFLNGRAQLLLQRTNEARAEFIAARDLDSMPWRATSAQQQAIRAAANRLNAPLCDLEEVFRAHSPGGCVGWELMDDHVHPTLRGQALMAEAIVQTMQRSKVVPSSELDMSRLRSTDEYGQGLGENPYDEYAVNFSMFQVFQVPFMYARNADAWTRFRRFVEEFEKLASPEMLAVLRQWQSETSHAGARRPLTGMVARQFTREKRFEEALRYYQIAQTAVPEYTSWHMEYVYFALVCREKLAGSLSEDEREIALKEIRQGKVLLRQGLSENGLAERYMGRLHQLRGEWAEAIPYLNASRERLGGFDLVAADQALFMSFLKTGRTRDARQLAEFGTANSGQYAGFYRQMLDLLEHATIQTTAPDEG